MYTPLANILIKAGADVLLKNENDKDKMDADYAIESGNNAVFDVLQEAEHAIEGEGTQFHTPPEGSYGRGYKMKRRGYCQAKAKQEWLVFQIGDSLHHSTILRESALARTRSKSVRK